jgi:hypothetical protein
MTVAAVVGVVELIADDDSDDSGPQAAATSARATVKVVRERCMTRTSLVVSGRPPAIPSHGALSRDRSLRMSAARMRDVADLAKVPGFLRGGLFTISCCLTVELRRERLFPQNRPGVTEALFCGVGRHLGSSVLGQVSPVSNCSR